MRKTKTEITQAIIDHLPQGHDVTLDIALTNWWVNIRQTGGLRLTETGYDVLESLNIPSWSVIIDVSIFNRKVMLDLDRKLQAPYYIVISKKKPAKLVMFNSKEAMLAGLYGDLAEFLKNYQ